MKGWLVDQLMERELFQGHQTVLIAQEDEHLRHLLAKAAFQARLQLQTVSELMLFVLD
jgi:hypothetical protein